jgi:small-conductance mechanosensitive channel
MKGHAGIASVLLIAAASLSPVPARGASPPATSIQASDVVAHLEQTIGWYRRISTDEPSTGVPGDILFREATQQNSTKALQLAFDFARAEAATFGSGTANSNQPQPSGAGGTNPNPGSQDMQAAASKAAGRVSMLQDRIKSLDSEIAKASGRSRATLTAQRSELQAELDLAQEIQTTIRDFTNFSGGAGSGGGLLGEINDLERSVPGAEHNPSNAPAGNPARNAPPSAAAAASSTIFHPESAGILGLITELFTMRSSRAQLGDLLKETDGLIQSIDKLRTPLANDARQSVARSDAIVSDSQDPAQLATAQQELTALASHFKQVSSAIVPLGEQLIMVQDARGGLLDWRSALDRQYYNVGRYFVLRAIMLALAIGVVLIISEVWRRATVRYVQDQRRRRQFLVVRRVVVGCAVALVLMLGFVTEFGSFATYAGFVTAGLAVALQNVLLSMVAYFFLIGRYGVRAGDRVTISGVTGDVVDIGLMRIYLMELTGTGPDLHATGRIVVYSNSVIFQPAALFKQMPGTDYAWRTLTLTLTPDSDYQVAERALTAAVNSVYEQYRASLEHQHQVFERSVDMEIATPHPVCRLQITENGLEFLARYPVEGKNAVVTDDQVLKAVHEAIEREPNLKLAASGSPKLQLIA